jgi:hypothetical protein
MKDASMKMSLVELYQLIGDNTGVSFLYDELPGVVVTIGFTLEDELDEDGDDYDGSDGNDGEDSDDGDEQDVQRSARTKRTVH